ncbi:MAG: hypothetical protein GXX85_16215 [Ignavibacteria bacterium]|nr:hypothetical protein [Ignavibacteria bacterium]
MNYTPAKIGFFLALIVSVAAIIYVYLVAELKLLVKEKVQKEELLQAKKSVLSEKEVQIQLLTAEERITEYAKNNLGLVRSIEKFETIKIDKLQLDQISEVINNKYE